MSLAKAGFRVTLISGRGEAMTDGTVRVKIINIPARRVLRMSIGVLRMLKEAIREKAGLYHIHDPELIPAGLFLRILGKKVVVDVHENLPAAIRSRPYMNPFFSGTASLLLRLMEHSTYPLFSALVTARPDISARFPRLHPVTLRNFPILPDLDEVEAAPMPAGPPGFIFVGGLSPIRGIRELILAFDGLAEARLWLLGPFESEDFRMECESLTGWENTRYLGVVGPQQIYPYLKAARAGIITFLPFPNHLTTLATKPFEYMAAGLPVIMSDFPYWRLTFADNAIYTDPADPSAIRECVLRLLNDDTLSTSMGKRNRELALEEFNWSVEEASLLGLYSKLSGK